MADTQITPDEKQQLKSLFTSKEFVNGNSEYRDSKLFALPAVKKLTGVLQQQGYKPDEIKNVLYDIAPKGSSGTQQQTKTSSPPGFFDKAVDLAKQVPHAELEAWKAAGRTGPSWGQVGDIAKYAIRGAATSPMLKALSPSTLTQNIPKEITGKSLSEWSAPTAKEKEILKDPKGLIQNLEVMGNTFGQEGAKILDNILSPVGIATFWALGPEGIEALPELKALKIAGEPWLKRAVVGTLKGLRTTTLAGFTTDLTLQATKDLKNAYEHPSTENWSKFVSSSIQAGLVGKDIGERAIRLVKATPEVFRSAYAAAKRVPAAIDIGLKEAKVGPSEYRSGKVTATGKARTSPSTSTVTTGPVVPKIIEQGAKKHGVSHEDYQEAHKLDTHELQSEAFAKQKQVEEMHAAEEYNKNANKALETLGGKLGGLRKSAEDKELAGEDSAKEEAEVAELEQRMEKIRTKVSANTKKVTELRDQNVESHAKMYDDLLRQRSAPPTPKVKPQPKAEPFKTVGGPKSQPMQVVGQPKPAEAPPAAIPAPTAAPPAAPQESAATATVTPPVAAPAAAKPIAPPLKPPVTAQTSAPPAAQSAPVAEVTPAPPPSESAPVSGDIKPGQQEPPVQQGFVRLYRGEQKPGAGKGLPEWVKNDPKRKAAAEAEGRWFTNNRTEAEHYSQEAGENGQVTYVDVPEETAKNYLANGNPEASKYVHSTKRDSPNDEHYLPTEVAKQAKPLTATTAAPEIKKTVAPPLSPSTPKPPGGIPKDQPTIADLKKQIAELKAKAPEKEDTEANTEWLRLMLKKSGGKMALADLVGEKGNGNLTSEEVSRLEKLDKATKGVVELTPEEYKDNVAALKEKAKSDKPLTDEDFFFKIKDEDRKEITDLWEKQVARIGSSKSPKRESLKNKTSAPPKSEPKKEDLTANLSEEDLGVAEAIHAKAKPATKTEREITETLDKTAATRVASTKENAVKVRESVLKSSSPGETEKSRREYGKNMRDLYELASEGRYSFQSARAALKSVGEGSKIKLSDIAKYAPDSYNGTPEEFAYEQLMRMESQGLIKEADWDMEEESEKANP